jgi:hypothetical protein
MKNVPDQKFEVGDRVKFVLRNGKIEQGVVRAVILTTSGPVLNVSFGPNPVTVRWNQQMNCRVPVGTNWSPFV